MTPAEIDKTRDGFVDIIATTLADGTRRFSNDDVEHYLPLFLLKSGLVDDTAALSPEERALLDGFVAKSGLKHKASPQEALAAVEGYYSKNPVSSELDKLLTAWARATFNVRPRSAGDVARSLAAFTALDPVPRVLGGGGRPEGTLPGGVLGRLATTKKD